jgi:hypothetical protein
VQVDGLRTATERPASPAVPPLRALAAAIGNRAFTAHVARQPMTASQEEEEIPATVTRVAEDVIGKPIDEVSVALKLGSPPGKWPALRARVAAATAGYDMVNLSLAGFAGQHWRDAKDNTYVALGLMDAMIAPDGFQNLRMAWGRSYGTLEQIANQSEPERAAKIREKALPPVLEGINMIPALEKEEDKEKLLEIRQEGLEIETDIREACGDEFLGFAAVQQFRLGLEILRMATLEDDDRQRLVAGWLDRAIFDLTNLDGEPSEPYPPTPADDDGDALPPPKEPASNSMPAPAPAPSPNPLPPPPPPPITP